MFVEIKPKRKWSEIGLIALAASIVGTIVLCVGDGTMRYYLVKEMYSSPTTAMLSTWVTDFRYLFEQGVYAATIFFVGAKFFETRAIFTIGFDKIDGKKVVVRGPDDNNVVWIGHAYANRLEAEAVSDAISERLKQSATA